MPILKTARLTDDGKAISLMFENRDILRFHGIWLRDNARDPETISSLNGQKLITLADIPEELFMSEALVKNDTLSITFMPENKTVSYPAGWLLSNCYDQKNEEERVELWASELGDAIPTVEYSAYQKNDEILQNWLSDFCRLGFARLINGPTRPQSLLNVIRRFGYVRETNYGIWFDVRSEVKPVNLAYTGLGLQAHTDNPYRDPVPTLQLLYCLENTVEGGESLLVDGFMAAARLRENSTEAFRLLSSYNTRFAYEGEEGVALRSKRPMIELDPEGKVIAVRFNNRSCAPLVDIPFEEMPAYYDAYRAFGKIIDDPEMAIKFKLEAGECFLVDNTRILHARTEFSGTGKRWLQGCYADKDGLLSRLNALEMKKGEAA
ncbi:MAG: TauD/TfdA family dioxygenase [Sneathiellales bacterium]|nr:TauD/TfdA family dioxygenase [Sneathiellales bacterium]